MEIVPYKMVGLERMLDYRGVGLERFTEHICVVFTNLLKQSKMASNTTLYGIKAIIFLGGHTPRPLAVIHTSSMPHT